MKYLLLLLIGLYSSSARKEDFEGLEYLMNNPKLLSDLEKRLGDLLSDDNSGSENAEAELPCNATIGTLNSAHSRCTFETDEDQIIKTTESINNGAKFVGKVENILCAKDCTMKCCNNSECDTAVYQDKDDHKCYMFKCGSPSVCVFDAHINYRVSYFKSKLEKSSFVPDVTHLSHENELENLDSHIMEPEPAVTIAPTTVEPLLTTTVRPALGESCKYFGPRCLDPHAECYMRECSCRAGYREKYGICRKICRQEEFECDNEGLGADAPQCVHGSYRCDGHRDCVDGSDEYNCPKIDEGYKGVPASNMYQSQLFPYAFNNYGYQAPGLSNHKPAVGSLPSNQIYQNQVPASGIQNGQYYVPGFSNQNQGVNIPQTGDSQVNNWPFIDKSGAAQPILQNADQSPYNNIDPSAYQNSVPFQSGQQNSISNQRPNVPLIQDPGSNIQQIPVQVHPVNQKANLNPTGNKQAQVVVNNQPAQSQGRQDVADHGIKPTELVPMNRPVTKTVGSPGKDGYHIAAQEKGQDQKLMNHPSSYQLGKQFHILGDMDSDVDYLDEAEYSPQQVGDSGRGHVIEYDTFDDQNQKQIPSPSRKVISPKKGTHTSMIGNDGINEEQYSKGRFRPDDGQRHSAEDVNTVEKGNTYPPTTKSKSQIEKPTQSTIAGQKSGHNPAYASERIEDFPTWIQYDSDSQNINAKKGKHVDGNDISRKADNENKESQRPKPGSSPDQRPTKSDADKSTINKGKSNSDEMNDDTNFKYNGYDSEDTGRFPTNDYPGNNRDRRPGYDTDSYRERYRDRYHRPNQDSRYPYFDNSGYRGRDRYHYPVWDPYREDYFYPDSYDNRKNGNSRVLDYEEYRTENQPGHKTENQDSEYKPKGPVESLDHAEKTVIAKPPKTVQGTDTDEDSSDLGTQGAPSPDENTQDDNSNPAVAPKAPEAPPAKVITTLAPSIDDKEDSGSENQTPEEKYKNSNSSNTKDSEESVFTYFSSEDKQKVESYTDSSQGPIVALALGLAITLILLIFVGCRLRTVKRRLRKGRALHSNEADYLINGMYL